MTRIDRDKERNAAPALRRPVPLAPLQLRVLPLLHLPLLLLLLLGSSAALSGASGVTSTIHAVPGLRKPILVVPSNMPPLVVDLGGDGISDVIAGPGFLNGEVLLDYRAVLARSPSGEGWDCLGGFADVLGGSAIVVDLDGDGLEDLLGHWANGTRMWRQRADRSFELTQTFPYPDSYSYGYDVPFPDASGKLLQWYQTKAGACLCRLIDARRPGSAWTELWREDVGESFGWVGLDLSTDPPNALFRCWSDTSSFWLARSIEDFGLGEEWSFPAPAVLYPFAVDRGDRFELWSVNPGRDGLWHFETDRATRSYRWKEIAIADLPEGARFAVSNVRQHLLPDGDVLLGLGGEDNEGIHVARIDRSGHATSIGWLPSHGLLLDGFLQTAGGGLDLLVHDLVHLWSIPEERWRPAETAGASDGALLPLRVADVTGDGRNDLVVHKDGEVESFALARGLPRPPWFDRPVPFAGSSPYAHAQSAVACGNLVPGGGVDVAVLEEEERALTLRFFVWKEWRLDDAGAVTIDLEENDGLIGRLIVADLDGDGIDEAILSTYAEMIVAQWSDGGIVLRSWEPVGWLRDSWDMDGDGADELLVDRNWRELVMVHADLAAGGITGRWGVPETWRNYASSLAADLDGDERQELLVLTPAGLLAAEYDSTNLVTTRWILQLDVTDVSRIASVQDVDSDGTMDVILSGSTVHLILDPLGYPRHFLLAPEESEYCQVESAAYPGWEDLDGDGDLDLAVLCRDKVRVHWNPIFRGPDGAGRGAAPDWVRLVSPAAPGQPPRVSLRLAETDRVRLTLVDVAGRRLWSRMEEVAGGRWVDFPVAAAPFGRRIARGIYFLKIEGGGRAAARSVLLGF